MQILHRLRRLFNKEEIHIDLVKNDLLEQYSGYDVNYIIELLTLLDKNEGYRILIGHLNREALKLETAILNDTHPATKKRIQDDVDMASVKGRLIGILFCINYLSTLQEQYKQSIGTDRQSKMKDYIS